MATADSDGYLIQERDVDGIIVLALSRDLKGPSELTLKERIDALVREGHRQIVVDLKNLPYVDSTGLGRLIRAHISVRQSGGRVRLCNVTPRVMDLLKLSRLDTVLDIYATEEEALAAVRSKALV
ncbi:MAG: STAS domain-containing protein [Acidobacteria bacterium]|nr:STAS domain-containing protein [Acidobacteriota bacterium]